MKPTLVTAIAFLFFILCLIIWFIWVLKIRGLEYPAEIIANMGAGMCMLLAYIHGVMWVRDIKKSIRRRKRDMKQHEKWMLGRKK